MNILITVYDDWRASGGTAVSTELIAKNLAALGHRVFIASTGDYPQIKTFVFSKIRRLPIFALRDWYLKKFFLRLIKQEKIDLIYASDCRFTAVAAILAGTKAGIKTVVHYRDYWFRCLRGDMLHGHNTCDGHDLDFCYSLQVKKILLWELYKLVYFKKRQIILNSADLNLSVSAAMRKRLHQAGLNNRTEIIYDLFDLERSNNDRVSSDRLKIIFVGRLVDHRGLKTMMSIAKGLKDRGVLFSLVIVGEGELMNYCKNFIKNHELVNVGLVGLLSHETVSDQYRSADTFLFPARLEEPLGRVVVEAMSAGLPVIASRVGGILELVTDGVEGFLVDKNDISGFIDKLLLLQDKSLLSKMSTAAIKKADSFDQLLVAKRLNDLITGL